jgi:hypothetical protein
VKRRLKGLIGMRDRQRDHTAEQQFRHDEVASGDAGLQLDM